MEIDWTAFEMRSINEKANYERGAVERKIVINKKSIEICFPTLSRRVLAFVSFKRKRNITKTGNLNMCEKIFIRVGY